jgi:hypothetical protein
VTEIAIEALLWCIASRRTKKRRPRATPWKCLLKKWRELIKKVWDADPLRCPKC